MIMSTSLEHGPPAVLESMAPAISAPDAERIAAALDGL